MPEEHTEPDEEIEIEEEELSQCRVCGGELYVLGALGKLMWFRCQNCGMQCCEEVN